MEEDTDTTQGAASEDADTALLIEAHRLSNAAFSLAKDYLSGTNRDTAKQQAQELEARVPELAARMASAPAALRPDLNRALSDARLDLGYILSDGRRPTSIRLHQFQSDAADPAR